MTFKDLIGWYRPSLAVSSLDDLEVRLGNDVQRALQGRILWDCPAHLVRLSACGMGIRLLRDQTVGPRTRTLVQAVIAGDIASYEQALEPLTVEGRYEAVGCLLEEALFGPISTATDNVLEVIIKFAHLGWDDQISHLAPLAMDFLLDDLRDGDCEFVEALFAAATLDAFRRVNPVPDAEAAASLMLALRQPAPLADAEALRAFLRALARGSSYGELASELARADHGPLLAAFAAVAPEAVLRWLLDQMAVHRRPRDIGSA